MGYKSNKKEILKAIEKAEERALEGIGEFVVTEAKVRTPVDSGNLRGSMDKKVDTGNKSVSIGTNVEYSIFVEKGTRFQKSQPYLAPAVEENKKRIKKLASELMKID